MPTDGGSNSARPARGSNSATRAGLRVFHLQVDCLQSSSLPLNTDLEGIPLISKSMSDPPPGKQSKKSRLLRPFKGLFSKSNRSPSQQSDNASASISASLTNSPTFGVNLQGTKYTAMPGLSTTPWEHRMKKRGSIGYEGLKKAIQGIYNFSGSFPPLQTTVGVLLTISKVVDVRGSVLYL